MRRIVAAFRIFFRALFNADVAREVERILKGLPAPAEAASPPPAETKPPAPVVQSPLPKPTPPPAPARSEALTLLATLQREGRLVDFLKEPLEEFTDAQIGAAARDVHRDCAAALERIFAIRAVLPDEEGAEVEVPQGFDAGRYRLTGKVKDEPRARGQLVHHGWEATRCTLAAWTGSDAAAKVIAPAELEVK